MELLVLLFQITKIQKFFEFLVKFLCVHLLIRESVHLNLSGVHHAKEVWMQQKRLREKSHEKSADKQLLEKKTSVLLSCSKERSF